MFYQTYTERRLQRRSAALLCTPITPSSDGMVPSAVRRYLQRARYNAFSMGRKSVPVTLTLTFKLIRARDQTLLPCDFGANPFSGSGDISHTNKKLTNSAKNRTFRSSLRAVIIWAVMQWNIVLFAIKVSHVDCLTYALYIRFDVSKGKGFPILNTERWARSWSRCTGSQPAGDRKSSTRR